MNNKSILQFSEAQFRLKGAKLSDTATIANHWLTQDVIRTGKAKQMSLVY
jgi:hypothetical protein